MTCKYGPVRRRGLLVNDASDGGYGGGNGYGELDDNSANQTDLDGTELAFPIGFERKVTHYQKIS